MFREFAFDNSKTECDLIAYKKGEAYSHLGVGNDGMNEQSVCCKIIEER